jgi:hypothetical protein
VLLASGQIVLREIDGWRAIRFARKSERFLSPVHHAAQGETNGAKVFGVPDRYEAGQEAEKLSSLSI